MSEIGAMEKRREGNMNTLTIAIIMSLQFAAACSVYAVWRMR